MKTLASVILAAILLLCSASPILMSERQGDDGFVLDSKGIDLSAYIDPNITPEEEERQFSTVNEKLGVLGGFIDALGYVASSNMLLKTPSEDAMLVTDELVIHSARTDLGRDLVLGENASIVFEEGSSLLMGGHSLFIQSLVSFSGDVDILFANDGFLCMGSIAVVGSSDETPYRIISDPFTVEYCNRYDLLADLGDRELEFRLNIDLAGDDPHSSMIGEYIVDEYHDNVIESVRIMNNVDGREIDFSFLADLDDLFGYIRSLDSDMDTIVRDTVNFLLGADTASQEIRLELRMGDVGFPLSFYSSDGTLDGSHSVDTRGFIRANDLELILSKYDRNHGMTVEFEATEFELIFRDAEYVYGGEGSHSYFEEGRGTSIDLENPVLIAAPGDVFDIMFAFDSCSVMYSDSDIAGSIGFGATDCVFEAPGERLKEVVRNLIYDSFDFSAFLGIFNGMGLELIVNDIECDITETDSESGAYTRTLLSILGENTVDLELENGINGLVSIPDLKLEITDVSGDEVSLHSVEVTDLYVDGFIESDDSIAEYLIGIMSGNPVERPVIVGAGLSMYGSASAGIRSYTLSEGLGATFTEEYIDEGRYISYRIASFDIDDIDVEYDDEFLFFASELLVSADMGGVYDDALRIIMSFDRFNIAVEASDLIRMGLFDLDRMVEHLSEGIEIGVDISFDQCTAELVVPMLDMDTVMIIGDGDSTTGHYASMDLDLVMRLAAADEAGGVVPAFDMTGSSLAIETEGDHFLTATYTADGRACRTVVSGVSAFAPINFDHTVLMDSMDEISMGLDSIMDSISNIDDPDQLGRVLSLDGALGDLLLLISENSGVSFDSSSLLTIGSVCTECTDLAGSHDSLSMRRWVGSSMPFEQERIISFIQKVTSTGDDSTENGGERSFTVSRSGYSAGSEPLLSKDFIESCMDSFDSSDSGRINLDLDGMNVSIPADGLRRLTATEDGSYCSVDIKTDISTEVPEHLKGVITESSQSRMALFLTIEPIGAQAVSDLGPVEVSFRLPQGMDVSEGYSVYCITGDGYEKMPTAVTTGEDGIVTVSFTTTHFSDYALMSESSSEDSPPVLLFAAAIVIALVGIGVLIRIRR